MNSDLEKNIDPLKKIQAIEFEILKEFVRICDERGLQYYVWAGTLLGAVRHNGPIPWDDDMDVGMPRPDYERFNELCMKENVLPSHLSIMHTEITHLFDNRTEVEAPHILGDKDKFGVLIDIFPIDGYPDGKLRRSLHYYHFALCQLMIRMALIDRIKPAKRRSMIDNLIIECGRIIHANKLVNKKKWVERAHNALKRYDYRKSEYVALSFSRYRKREIIPASMLGNGCKLKYLSIEVNAPEKWDEYLSRIYGDYMQPPPENERGGHSMRVISAGK